MFDQTTRIFNDNRRYIGVKLLLSSVEVNFLYNYIEIR